MILPKGYLALSNKVCKLKKSLFGLKQASKDWNGELNNYLMTYDFQHSPPDYCMFTRKSRGSFLAILVYVDDLLILAPSMADISEFKSSLDKAFTIKDLEPAKYFF